MTQVHQAVKNKDEADLERNINCALEKVKGKVPPETLSLIKTALIKATVDGTAPNKLMGISEDFMEEIYTQGYHLFQSGKFKEALNFFDVLLLFKGGNDPRLGMAIAATHHHLKNYEEAIHFYLLHLALHPKEPLAYFHMSDCFKKMNRPGSALHALEKAKHLAMEDEKFAYLRNKIELELGAYHSLKEKSLS